MSIILNIVLPAIILLTIGFRWAGMTWGESLCTVATSLVAFAFLSLLLLAGTAI